MSFTATGSKRFCGNLTVRKCVTDIAAGVVRIRPNRERIVDVANGAEIAAAHRFGRNGVDRNIFTALGEAFVVGEEEHFVLDDRAAEARAELVLTVSRLGLTGGAKKSRASNLSLRRNSYALP